MERTVRSGERRAYATAVADLWERLGIPLARLERIAESPPERLGDEVLEELPPLQYNLHAGAELALGIEPPGGRQNVHAELVAALAHARDATAEAAWAIGSGDQELVAHLLPEWRGALFRVRLARLRALEHQAARPAETGVELPAAPLEHEAGSSGLLALGATVLVLAGALLFTAGAVLAAWPVWAAGLALFAGGFVLFRP